MNRKLLTLLLIAFVTFSCKKKDNNQSKTTWISGQIVNPKLDYVIFLQGGTVLDTVPLDSENFFSFHSDDMKEGLYVIRHYETQVFYVNPGDSLLLHLNTMDFDESLNYSGRGAAKNNLLMDFFLANERENKEISKWYTFSPEEYTAKIDSLRDVKLQEFEEYIANNEVSEQFKEVALASINYDYYSKKELYATANKKRLGTLDDSFYSYRKDIDYGNEGLRFYYPYYRFMIHHLDNLMVSKFPFGVNRTSYEFSVDKLRAIDSLYSNDSIRNILSRFTALRYFYNAKEAEGQKELLDLFEKINNNKRHKEEISQLSASSINMAQGRVIPDVSLLTMENTVVTLHEIIKRPTVLYFWNDSSTDQATNNHNRALELKSKYPEYDFLGINTDNHFRRWRNKVKNLKYDSEMEFQLENADESKKTLVLGFMNKAIILDKDQTILDGSSNLFNSNFEELLLGYLNR